MKRLKVGEVINGKPSGMALGLDFDFPEAIIGMFASEGYAALVPMGDKASRR